MFKLHLFVWLACECSVTVKLHLLWLVAENTNKHPAPGVTKWCDEYENDVNFTLWPSQSADLTPS